MLLIQEVGRLLAQLVAYSRGTRRIGILVLVVLIALITTLSATATTVTPIALYPFI